MASGSVVPIYQMTQHNVPEDMDLQGNLLFLKHTIKTRHVIYRTMHVTDFVINSCFHDKSLSCMKQHHPMANHIHHLTEVRCIYILFSGTCEKCWEPIKYQCVKKLMRLSVQSQNWHFCCKYIALWTTICFTNILMSIWFIPHVHEVILILLLVHHL